MLQYLTQEQQNFHIVIPINIILIVVAARVILAIINTVINTIGPITMEKQEDPIEIDLTQDDDDERPLQGDYDISAVVLSVRANSVGTSRNRHPFNNESALSNRHRSKRLRGRMAASGRDSPDNVVVLEEINLDTSNVSDNAQIVGEYCVREPVVVEECLSPQLFRRNTRSRANASAIRSERLERHNDVSVANSSQDISNQSDASTASSVISESTSKSTAMPKSQETISFQLKNLEPESPVKSIPFQCPICMTSIAIIDSEQKTNIVSTRCGHIFCESCIIRSFSALGKACPKCRKTLKGKAAPYHRIFLD